MWMRRRSFGVSILLASVGVMGTAGTVRSDLPNYFQPARMSSLAIFSRLETCAQAAESNGTPRRAAMLVCSCTMDAWRIEFHRAVRAGRPDPGPRHRDIDRCAEWARSASRRTAPWNGRTPHSRGAWTSYKVHSYMDGCAQSEGSRDGAAGYCGCTLDAMRTNRTHVSVTPEQLRICERARGDF